jgi:hypothetical protein|tara:strand:- start:4 stop:1608 length:1605 start_codon:yes stop_codon:yes gene_type:complete
MPLPRNSKTVMPTERTTGDVAIDFARAGAQGFTFGFADEIEAAVTSAFNSGKSYAEVVKDVRSQINSFRERNPASAYGAEIAGAILPTIAAQLIPGGQAAIAATGTRIAQGVRAMGGGQKLQRGAQVAAGAGAQGAVYGAGAAEGTPLERLPSAAASGAMSAVAGPLVDKVAPTITAKAADLLKKGVPLTPGQAVGESGLLGRGLKRLEEGVADNVFLIGDAVRGAFDRAQRGFNRATVTEALAPINAKIPKGLEGKRLVAYGQRLLSASYDKTLGKMKVDNSSDLLDELIKITKVADSDVRKYVDEAAFRNIISQVGSDGSISGKSLKQAQTRLRKDIRRLIVDGSEEAARKADALEDMRSVLNAAIAKENPKLAPQLNNIDKAYGQFEIVRNAELRRKTSEGFNPGDLLQAAAKGDPTKRQSQFSAGEARMQRLAQDAQDVLGNTTPNSGTAGRQQAARIVTGNAGVLGAGQVDPITAGMGLMAPVAYSSMGVPVGRTAVANTGRAMRAAVPVAAANTTEMSRQMLADILRR